MSVQSFRPATHVARAVLLSALVAFGTAAAQNVPQGFVDEPVITAGLSNPVGMAFLPDGRFLVLEQNSGRILVVAGGTTGVVGQVQNVESSMTEQGALGIAVDPAWPTWPYVYVTYTRQNPANVVLQRYTLVGDLTSSTSTALLATDPKILLDDLPDASPFHQAGTVRFGPDGMLYLSLGDDLTSCGAQDPAVLAGAILRLDVTPLHGLIGGTPPTKATLAAAGNPLVGTNEQLVWAQGLRNPFRFNIDPVNGALYIGDVGQSSWEELNQCSGPGLNFGWPLEEGPAAYSTCPTTPNPIQAPIAAYAHPSSGGINQASIVPFGGRYRNIPGAPFNFGPAYEGTVFYLDFWQGFVRTVGFDGVQWNPGPTVAGQPNATDWATGMQFVSDAVVAPDGALYYVKWVPGSIRRIRPDSGGFQLVAVAGDDQVGNAGWTAFQDLEARYTNLAGLPVAGQPITFQIAAGGGVLGPQPVMTDLNGIARTTFQLPEATAANPILITATGPGAAPITFAVEWRGLAVEYSPLANALQIRVRHSQTDSGFFLGWQLPPGAALQTPFGDVVLSLDDPTNMLGWLDGLGLYGPADPVLRTGPTFPEFSIIFPQVPPTGGLTVLAQAFALDSTKLGSPEAFFVSNGVTVTLP